MIKSTDLPALKQRFHALLRDELNVARFSQDDAGDFLFHYERMRMKLVFDDKDPAFVWLAYFGMCWIDSDDPEAVARADTCISEVNHRIKAAKISRAPESDKDGEHPVTVSISFIAEDVASQDSWTLERYLGQIKTAADLFCDLFRRPSLGAEASAPDISVRH